MSGLIGCIIHVRLTIPAVTTCRLFVYRRREEEKIREQRRRRQVGLLFKTIPTHVDISSICTFLWIDRTRCSRSPSLRYAFFEKEANTTTPHPKKIVKKGAEPKMLLGSRPAQYTATPQQSILFFTCKEREPSVCYVDVVVGGGGLFSLPVFLSPFSFTFVVVTYNIYSTLTAAACVCVCVLARRAT